MVAGLMVMISSPAFAENVLIYSYTKTAIKPADWALVPDMADIPNTEPVTLFEALKKRKLPTYGATSYDAAKNIVQIDADKCPYGSIISGEVTHTFDLYHHPNPRFICGHDEIMSANAKLMYYVGVVPLWQALSADVPVADPNLVQIGTDFLRASDFSVLLYKHDKKLASTIETGFSDASSFVKSGLMKGYIAHRFPNAEKRVAKELTSKTISSVNSAMGALAQTKDPAIIKTMRSILNTQGEYQEVHAQTMIEAGDSSLRDDAALIMLKSPNDAVFNKAREKLVKENHVSLLYDHLEEVLVASTPAHANTIAHMIMDAGGASRLTDYLNKAGGDNATAQALAVTLIAYAKDKNSPIDENMRASMKRAAWGIQLSSDQSTVAYDALDDLRKNDAARSAPSIWIRGLKSRFEGIRLACALQLETVESLSEYEKSQLLSSFSNPDDPIQTFMPEATVALSSSIGAPRDILKNSKSSFIEKRAAYLALQGDDIELTRPVSNAVIDGARLLSLVKHNHPDRMAQISGLAYHDSPTMRRDVAYSTRWLNTSGDTLRTTILRDSDETVVMTLLRQFPKRPREEISLPMIKEITARAERSSALKIAVLNIIPLMMNDKTHLSITTYASNEMFDQDVQVRIAAIRALSEIAIRTEDPVVADNAISSLALTVQDESEEIVHHTLVSLAKTRNPVVANIIASVMKTHPKSAERALEIYPFLGE